MIVVFSILLFVFLPLVTYYPNVSTDYPLISDSLLSSGFSNPLAWNFKTAQGLGEDTLFTLWSWPMDFSYGLLHKIGFGADSIQLIVIASIFTIGVISMNKLLASYKLHYKARIAGTLFYLLNTYFVLLIDGGQLMIALAYVLLPANYYMFCKAVEGRFRDKLNAAVLISISGYADVRFLYILALVLGLKFISEIYTKKASITGWFTTGVVSAITFLLLHFYWIYPVYVHGLDLPQSISGSENIAFLSFAKLKHAVLLLQPHWYLNSFGQIAATKREFILIPILAFLPILISKERKQALFWIMISIAGILLVKGSNPPFEHLYEFLFTNVPGFFIFRDPSKFYFLIALGYSILIAFAINSTLKRAPVIFGLFVIYLILLVSPVYTARMTGLLSKPQHFESFENVKKILEEDKTFGRVLWVPGRHQLAYTSLVHPVVEAIRIESLRPFAIGNVGTYETQNFLREGVHIPQLLNLSGIKYIAYTYPDDRKRELSDDEKEYYQIFSSQLADKDYLTQIYHDDAVSLYKVDGDIEKFFIAENVINISESDDIYDSFTFDNENNLKNNALIIDESYKNKFIYPSESFTRDPNSDGWWKRDANEFVWLRNFLQEKYEIDNQDLSYGGGFAICEGQCIFQFPEEVKEWEEVYVRLLSVSNPSTVEKRITGYGDIPDQIFSYRKSDFVWQKFTGELDSLKLDSEVNIINALSPNDPGKDVISLKKGRSTAGVSYQMVNPTKYRLDITGISGESILVFADSFSSKWSLNGQSPEKVYDLFNGFIVSKDGKYDLIYTPQESVEKGLLVSGLSALVIGIILVRWRKLQA